MHPLTARCGPRLQIQVKRRELTLLKDQNQRAEQQTAASEGSTAARRGSVTARAPGNAGGRGGQMSERRRSVAKLLAQNGAPAEAPATADGGAEGSSFHV